MKKFKILSVLLTICLLFVSLTACADKGDIVPSIQKTTDKYRTYYEIFPYSFADSNGDGTGDLQGIIDKLDYIDGLNYDGLWLTPVHQSTTYHKYDVIDYCSIDRVFGTLTDYDNLVKACHDRGMTVLLDLVFNHTSSKHEWFERCISAHSINLTTNKYYNYYNVRPVSYPIPSGWAVHPQETSLMYECKFWSEMPDLNLQNVLDEPDGYLATDLKNVMKFWLVDHKVDGFRLDAVSEYFDQNHNLNKRFLKWLNDTAKEFKPDCYIVGEGTWGNPGANQTYYESGIDGVFAFQNGYTANGNLSYAVRLEKAGYLSLIDTDTAKSSAPGIPANFIANHDTGRAYGISLAGANPENLKEIHGLLAMTYGVTFSYYGDEAGMTVLAQKGSKDSYKDEDKRQPMPWGDKYQCKPVAGSTKGEDSEKYLYGKVSDQLKDANSLPNYVKRANAIRRAFPQIARNVAEQIYVNRNRDLCVVKKGSGKDAVYIVWNASKTLTQTYDSSSLGKVKLSATLSTDISKIPSIQGSVLTLPPATFAVLQ